MSACTPDKLGILQRNGLEYDDADDAFWRRTVYEAVHDGWAFASIGGRHVLDVLIEETPLGEGSTAFELCCGLGETCIYLAERTGCTITGVEMNQYQVARARERVALRGSILSSRIRILHADVLEWRPDPGYRAGLCVDSLMLLDDPLGAVAAARRALHSDGVLVVADVLAGPTSTEAIRRFAWEEDGIVSLLAPDAQDAVLRAAGFRRVERRPRTDLAIDCFQRMLAASERHRPELVAAKGQDRHDRWVTNAAKYLEHFVAHGLEYAITVARP